MQLSFLLEGLRSILQLTTNPTDHYCHRRRCAARLNNCCYGAWDNSCCATGDNNNIVAVALTTLSLSATATVYSVQSPPSQQLSTI